MSTWSPEQIAGRMKLEGFLNPISSASIYRCQMKDCYLGRNARNLSQKNPENPKLWVIDEEGAQIIEKIYNLRKQGENTVKIAKLLKYEKILIPSMYAAKKGYRKPSIKNPQNEYLWTIEMVRKILMNQSYVGDVVNFKTYSKSFKLKSRIDNDRENWQVHENVHKPIISRELFEEIQKSFGDVK